MSYYKLLGEGPIKVTLREKTSYMSSKSNSNSRLEYCIPINSRKDSDKCLWYAVDQVINIWTVYVLAGQHKLPWFQNKSRLLLTNNNLWFQSVHSMTTQWA